MANSPEFHKRQSDISALRAYDISGIKWYWVQLKLSVTKYRLIAYSSIELHIKHCVALISTNWYWNASIDSIDTTTIDFKVALSIIDLFWIVFICSN